MSTLCPSLRLSIVAESCISLDTSVLSVLQVLQQLPGGLAIAVLDASPADLEHHLSILPASLHPLAIEAAFPSIHRHHSLTLDFASLRNPATANMVLCAATSGTTEASALKSLELKNIPVKCNDRLQQLILAACRAASDVRLDFGCRNPHLFPRSSPFGQLGQALSHNSALTSLKLTFEGYPWPVVNYDRVLESLTGLQSLELASRRTSFDGAPPPHSLTTPSSITKLLCLTRLCLGPSFFVYWVRAAVIRIS
jgi:hypothetical protein